MQFSKKVTQLSRLHNIDPKDVLFALLISSGASAAEAFAVIFRPAASSNASLSTKASQHIGRLPGLRHLIDELTTPADTDQPTVRRGRPRKDQQPIPDDTLLIDYTDKDSLLNELARLASCSEKDSDRLAALREIGSLQRMKSEEKIIDEKKVVFYIPLSYAFCDELLRLLRSKG